MAIIRISYTMASCTELVKCVKTGNICLKPVVPGGSMCEYHIQLNNYAEPFVPGKCKWIRKNYKRCNTVIYQNGYCSFHQIDTISYRHTCGREAVCGCIHPAILKEKFSE
jgi:hypothetical protein